MTNVIAMARQAGSIDSEDVILTIYAAFAAHEREACAKLCEKLQNEAESVAKCFDATADECAEAIRARGEK